VSDSREKYEYMELMHAEIDGEASPEQLAALREYLAHHPEAQIAHAKLAKLTDILNHVEEVETPGDLRGKILAALPPRRPTLEIGVRNRHSLFRIPLIRYGYALAAGLLLGVVLTGVAFRNLAPVEKSAVYGIMTARENMPHYVVAEQMKLATPGLAGSVQLSRSGHNEVVVFDLNGEQAVDVEVRFDGSRAGVEGFSQEPSNIRSFEVKEGSVSFRSEGKQRSTLVLKGEKHAQPLLDLKFYVGDKLIHQGTLGGESQAGSPK